MQLGQQIEFFLQHLLADLEKLIALNRQGILLGNRKTHTYLKLQSHQLVKQLSYPAIAIPRTQSLCHQQPAQLSL